MGKGLYLSSSRVIAIGRLLLAALFLVAMWLDTSRPVTSREASALLGGYVLFAAVIVLLTWRDWWLDAKLAGPAHAVDIVMFTLLVLSTEGYASPFFGFFVFLLLSAAIRWSWLATALTAMLLSLIYAGVALTVIGSDSEFDLQPFIVRTSNLLILSLILIWFGATQWRSRFYGRQQDLLGRTPGDEAPFAAALEAAMSEVRARRGLFAWRVGNRPEALVLERRGTEVSERELAGQALGRLAAQPFLFDAERDRALQRDDRRNLIDYAATDLFDRNAIKRLGLGEGLAIPIAADDGEGILILERVPGLSTDHVDLAAEIRADVTSYIQRHALLRAAEENAEARARLSLARDLHDSVVQFLAGAAFRLEAVKRSEAAGRDVGGELDELKQLMLHEQRELRVFITGLRSGADVAFDALTADVTALGERLSRQWGTSCSVSARGGKAAVPTRVYLDVHQIVREAVANAARHASAKAVRIALSVADSQLTLEIINDGAALPAHGGRLEVPQSLSERVLQAGGTMDVARGMDVTRLSIALPLKGRRT